MSQDPENLNEGDENPENQGSIDGNEVNQNEDGSNEPQENIENAEETNKAEDSQNSPGANLSAKESSQQSESNAKTSTGLDENIAALISYSGGFVTGIIFFFLEKDNKFIRFHALQSTILTVAWLIIKNVLDIIPFIGWLLVLLVNGIALAIWIVCMVKAYQKQTFKLPVIGDLADQYK
ncbi:hypothetical protein J14TS2_11560 [Bacillus sp. J14TS2]|uniref:DUF4870 domain-containing protein n=1 Tax=Bacillus sp. J14TS2 TaxID=2807188 RepID=UPI001AFD9280|nr:DUF4870 domain-containing protein [Bacillus sp. J14TS2]GIN70681.1 hypothetical protein J14TS2_11560 [Bacillus sp. J14TS2]